MTTPKDTRGLMPNDKTRDEIVDKAAVLVRNLLAGNFEAAGHDAVEAFEANQDAGNPIVKLGVTVEYPLAVSDPKVRVVLAWSARRKHEAEADIDGSQARLEFDKPGGEPAGKGGAA